MVQIEAKKRQKKRVFTEDEITQAKQMDMLGYMENKGENFRRAGNYYYHKERDSLVICPEQAYFAWNSIGKSSKNCVTLAMEFFDLNFRDAVEDILEHAVSTEKTIRRQQVQSKQKPFVYEKDIRESDKTDDLKKYLIQERKIDPTLVSELIQKKYIVQDKQKNVVYKWLDPLQKNKIVGASKEGTSIIPENRRIKASMKRFKQVLAQGNEGFYIDVGKTEKLDKLYIFESPVDLLSYLTLKIKRGDSSIQNARFLSMDGVKESVFFHHYMLLIAKLKRPIQPICCVDNDHAGHVLLEKLNAFEYLDAKGENCLRNEIPYDLALTPELVKTYQEVAGYWQVEWEAIAAVHKVETNLKPQGSAANVAGIQTFFQNEKYYQNMDQQYMLLPEVMDCARAIRSNTKDEKINWEELYKSERMNETSSIKAISFIEKIRDYYEKYRSENYYFVQEIPKDWNDILVAIEEERQEMYTLIPSESVLQTRQEKEIIPEK
ncbi:DUF3991 domain-containing protein [Listeria seeligeri]|uniref:DUF3991 domain-containing protein n=1 Tax=Listeria seeligeri TaxID=1640 RepID=UPI001628ED24|nr:DUF3991 domain-containing protein [Listeria seeligeri]MBC1817178.1 DUF3991 domain-containing protein [Listeria seeligeri]